MFWWRQIAFMTLSEWWSRHQWMISLDMGCSLKEMLVIFLNLRIFLFNFKYINGNEVQYFLISFFGWCFNFKFYFCICGHFYPSESFSYYISEFIVIFKCSLIYCILCVLWHIIWWPEWYNCDCFWYFYGDKAKNFCREFTVIDNLNIIFYRYNVSKHYDVSEHMGVLSSIQLCSDKFDVSWMECLPLCRLRSQLWYWRKYSVSSIMFSVSLWWIDMIPEFVVVYGNSD